MKQKLKSLFAFQEFIHNPRLQRLLDETLGQDRQPVSEEDLQYINAAGVPDAPRKQTDDEKMFHEYF